jgi:membrane-bound inhibitor of C-type lysozyme
MMKTEVYASGMNKALLGIVVLIITGISVWYVYLEGTAPTDSRAVGSLGTYAYECDEHVVFTMTPASDMSSIAIAPTADGVYPPALTLMRVESTSGARFEAGDFSFYGQGESVVLTEGDQSLNCSPVVSAEEAPFNWGD